MWLYFFEGIEPELWSRVPGITGEEVVYGGPTNSYFRSRASLGTKKERGIFLSDMIKIGECCALLEVFFSAIATSE
jgi:hypothetical protein